MHKKKKEARPQQPGRRAILTRSICIYDPYNKNTPIFIRNSKFLYSRFVWLSALLTNNIVGRGGRLGSGRIVFNPIDNIIFQDMNEWMKKQKKENKLKKKKI